MKVLYLIYGKQSGVIHYFTKALASKKVKVTVFNPKDKFTYRISRFEFPSFRPQNIVNSLFAFMQYKQNWRRYFFRH